MGFVFLGNRIFMSLRFLCFFVGFFCAASSANAKVTAESVSLGEQRPGKHVPAHAQLNNDSDKPVVVLSQHPSYKRFDVKPLPLSIPAHGSAQLIFDVHVDRQLGVQNYSVDLDLDSDQKTMRVYASLFVDSAILQEPKTADLGIVTASKQAEQRIDLRSQDLPDLRARSTQDGDKMIDTDLIDGGKAVILRSHKDAAWGMHDGWVEVTTNSDQQPTVWIKYRYEQRGRVVPETYEVNAGVQHVGKVSSQTLFIRDIEGAALQLGKVSEQGSAVSIKQTDCPVKAPSCRALEIKIDEKQTNGKISTVLGIELPQYKQTLSINYAGLLIGADTKIGDLNAEAQKRAAAAARPQDIADALKAVTTVKPAPIIVPTPPGNGPLLKWNVQNEQQIYGYIIYRADSEDGEMHRISDKLIHTQSKENEVSVEYRWRDASAQVGHTYWYQIGTISAQGIRNNLTGALKKTYSAEAKK